MVDIKSIRNKRKNNAEIKRKNNKGCKYITANKNKDKYGTRNYTMLKIQV